MAAFLPRAVVVGALGEVGRAADLLGVAGGALVLAADAAACLMGFLVLSHSVRPLEGSHTRGREMFFHLDLHYGRACDFERVGAVIALVPIVRQR
jgi:hypothetical protein